MNWCEYPGYWIGSEVLQNYGCRMASGLWITFELVVISVALGFLLALGLAVARLYGPRWAKLAKVDMNRPGASAVVPIVVTLIVSFVTAWVLAGAASIAWHFYDCSYLLAALGTGVILWAGFTAARFITHDAFEGRPSSLTVMNIAHELVTIVVMALIIGVWPPAGTV